MSVVYFVQAGAGGPIKIGYAADVRRRLSSLQNGSAELLTVLATIEGDRDVEGRFHRHLRPHRIRGEWFKPSAAVLKTIERAKVGEIPAGSPMSGVSSFSWLTCFVRLARVQVRCKGWSAERMAELAGIPVAALSGLEREDWNPPLSTLLALEKVIVRPVSELIDQQAAA